MRSGIIALDCGTTSCRALAFDGAGRIAGRAQRHLPLIHRHPGWVEQDAEGLLSACFGVIREASAGRGVDALVLGTYLHSLLVGPRVLLWADTRAAAEAERLAREDGGGGLYAATGCPPHPMYPLVKLLWLAGHGQAPARVESLKDRLAAALTGEWALDHACASASGLLDLRRLDWSDDALRLAGLRREQLPRLLPATARLPLSREGARLTGLPAGTPVVIGAGDGMLSSVGAGAIRPGACAVMVGTSGAVRVASAEPATDPRRRAWCYHVVPGLWLVGGALNNGGLVLDWLEALLGPEGGAAAWEDLAAGVPPGAGALLFLPFLTGERSPEWNARARGAVLGLGLEHGPAQLARAALEGVAFRLHAVGRALAEICGPPSEFRATGGFARSRLWVQICADVFGQTLAVPDQAEASAFGAWALARVALGLEPDLQRATAGVRIERTHRPDASAHRRYAELYEAHEAARRALEPVFARLAELREGEADERA